MAESMAIPDEWVQELEQIEFDSFMNREYTKLAFIHSPTGRKVRINDVQEPNKFGGWGYLVWVNDATYGELDLVEDLQTAKEIAFEFMKTHPL